MFITFIGKTIVMIIRGYGAKCMRFFKNRMRFLEKCMRFLKKRMRFKKTKSFVVDRFKYFLICNKGNFESSFITFQNAIHKIVV